MNAHPHCARLGPFAIVHAVVDHLVDEYRDVAVWVGTDVDAIEEQMFEPRSTTEIDQIYLLKREVLELRRAVHPLSGVLREMVSDDRDLIGREVLRHLHDVIDHQSLAAERINTYDVLLSDDIVFTQAAFDAFRDSLVRSAARDWTGVGDAKGKPMLTADPRWFQPRPSATRLASAWKNCASPVMTFVYGLVAPMTSM